MKIFISSGHPDSKAYMDAMNQLKTKLFEMRFDVTENVKDLPLVDCAYFMDGWLDNAKSRFYCGLCNAIGKYTLFQTANDLHRNYAKTLVVQLAVKNALGYTLDDLRGKSRNQDVVFARYLFAWYCHVHLHLRYTHIAKYMKRTHSTVMYYVESIRYILNRNVDFTFMYKGMMLNLVKLFALNNGCRDVDELGENKSGVWFKTGNKSMKYIICRPNGTIRAASGSEVNMLDEDPLDNAHRWTDLVD